MIIKPLILARDRAWLGGVRSIVDMMMENFSSKVEPIEMLIGQRINQSSRVRRVYYTVIDSILLAMTVIKRDISLVHLNPSLDSKSLMRDGLFLVILRIMGFRRTVVFFHGWDDATEKRLRRSVTRRRLFRLVYGSAAVILVLGSRFKASLVGMGIEPEKIKVITAMFDGQLLAGNSKDRNDDGKIIIFLSRLIKEKGIFELLDAFDVISRRFPDATLIIAGDGPDRNGIESWVKQHHLESRITLPGYLRGENKMTALRGADAFVLPTYHGEGCPVALLEAMAAGLAIITTPVGGIPDVFVDGENGILLGAVSAGEIVEAVEKLFLNAEFFRRVKDNNQRKAWESYEANVVTRKIELIYTEVAKKQ